MWTLLVAVLFVCFNDVSSQPTVDDPRTQICGRQCPRVAEENQRMFQVISDLKKEMAETKELSKEVLRKLQEQRIWHYGSES
jgi:hypothetical protein